MRDSVDQRDESLFQDLTQNSIPIKAPNVYSRISITHATSGYAMSSAATLSLA